MRRRPRGPGGKRKDIHERALGLLAVRQRSRRELERRLVQAGFEPDAVADELDRLEQVGLIDDEAFARAVVESRMGCRGESRRVVAGKLAQAGVAGDVAIAALDEAPEAEEERGRTARARPRLRGCRGSSRRSRSNGCTASSRAAGTGPRSPGDAARRALAVETVDGLSLASPRRWP